MIVSKDKSMMCIIYVADQEKSRSFYEKVFGIGPVLHVPGMTEFQLNDQVLLGIMPEENIYRLLEEKIPHPKEASKIPRCELYLFVEDPDQCLEKLIEAGGIPISEGSIRSWGHYVSYGLDPDGHILAFAKTVK